jgi:hypothetical protein
MRFLLLFHRSLYMQVRQTSSGSSIQNSGALPREGEASQAGPRPRMHSMQEGNSAAVSSSMPTQATQAAQSANSQSTREVRALFRQTPFENVRQHDVQLFDKAFNSSGIDPHIGSVSPIPQGFLPHVDALGRATQDPNIRQHFQNFLGRLDERNHVISSGRQPDVPKTDGKYFGSREHIQYGREVDQYLGIGNPALAAMLNPSGGKIGSGNDEVIKLGNASYPLIHHGQDHDARGYAHNYHNAGPGYSTYAPGNHYTGQVEGVLGQIFNPSRPNGPESEHR